MARLNHPHVVTVIDAGEDDGAPYIVFEYVEGETLKDRIRAPGPLPVSEAVAYAIEIGRGLSSAHSNRLVHRDVKPQNVLIDLDGRAKVTDFGIARSLETQGLTATGRVLGTTDYVSPEQAMGHDVTEQSDIYSLGICLYEMLTGEVPFQADTQVAVAMKHVKEPLPDVQRRRPEISAALAAVIERATAKETRHRYATVDAMVHDLEEVLAIEAARTGETTGEATTVLRSLPGETGDFAPRRMRHPRMALWASVLLIAMAGGLVAWFATRTEKGAGPSAAPQTPGLTDVRFGGGAASDYDPEGDDGEESPDQARNAIDGSLTTNWDTETYQGGFAGVHKNGVGIYVDTGRGGMAGASAHARHEHPRLQGGGLRVEHHPGLDPRLGQGQRRQEGQAERALQARHRRPQAALLPALDLRAAAGQQGQRARAQPEKALEAVLALLARGAPAPGSTAACPATRGRARR